MGNYYGSFEHATMPLSVQVMATQTETVMGTDPKDGYGGHKYDVQYPTTISVAHPGWGETAYPAQAMKLYLPRTIVNPPVLDPHNVDAEGAASPSR
jgi:hypothetical protein